MKKEEVKEIEVLDTGCDTEKGWWGSNCCWGAFGAFGSFKF